MKVASVIAAVLLFYVALPDPIQAKFEKPKYCVGRDGKHYLRGEHYDYKNKETKACIRYTCVRKGKKLKMSKKKIPCDEPLPDITANVTTLEASVKSLQASMESILEMVIALQFRSSQLETNVTTNIDAIKEDISSNVATLATKCDASSCASLQTTATDIESCLADITSSACRSPPSGKTSVAGGISANTAALADKCDASTCSDIQTTVENLKINVTTNKDTININRDDISTNVASLATKCDASSCTSLQTSATDIENCLADITSSACPSPSSGKTSVVEGISGNTAALADKCDASTCSDIQSEVHSLGLMLNPVVLLTGGSGSASHSVEVFSIGQNWHCSKNLEDIPNQRVDHTIHFFRGKIIMCGGQGNGKSCLSLNENQRFVQYSQLNDYRSYHVGAIVNDTLLISGGFGNPLQMEFWNGLQWEQSGNFNELNEFEMNSCMATIREDTILMAGGSYDRGSKFTNKMLKYKDGKWERMEDYPGVARRGHGCAFIQTPEGDAFLIAGGTTRQNNYQQSSYLYNIEKRQWEEVGKLATGRLGGRVLNVGGRIIIVGGSYGPVEVEEYNVYTKTWSTLPEKIKQERGQFDAVVVPGALVGC